MSDAITLTRPGRSAARMDPQELKAKVSAGLLSFPVTFFTPSGDFDPQWYRASIARAAAPGPAALFAAGGTGEFSSITQREYRYIVRTAVEGAEGQVPIPAGCGIGTRIAVEMAQASEELGAAGILLLPDHPVVAEQAGLYAHVKAVCDAVKIGVIVYNRDNSVLTPETLARLVEDCPNLVGFKDGHGDIEMVWKITTLLGDRLAYVGGMPTAEVFATPYYAAGVTTYSSAVYNFIPKAALAFSRGAPRRRHRNHAGDAAAVLLSLPRDPQPGARLCGLNRQGGHASDGRGSRSRAGPR